MSGERTQNQRLPMEQRLTTFEEVDKTYTPDEAAREASRCLGCPSRWCAKECPAGMPVPEFIKKVREEDYAGAYDLIAAASPLPEFCSRLCPQEKQCQSNCTRSIRTEAVGIGRLERFVVEQHYAAGQPESAAPATGKRVAVVGSGPSGLSAAVTLCKLGHAVTVIEAQPQPGGLLRYGIPGMKLSKDVLDRKLAAMEKMGITFQTGTAADGDAVKDYDAVVLAAGAQNARQIPMDGADGATGIYPAVAFLSGGTETAAGKDVIIIGGGDTGSDCVGTVIRQGAASVTQIEMLPQVMGKPIVYDPLPQKPKEKKFDASLEECLTAFQKDPHIYQATVKSVKTGADGHIVSATIVRLAPQYDENRRMTMVELPGTAQEIPCGLLVIAAGFLGPKGETAAAFGVKTTPRSNFAADGYQAGEKIFVCGDCRTGQSLVVKAMVDGRECAKAADAYLRS